MATRSSGIGWGRSVNGVTASKNGRWRIEDCRGFAYLFDQGTQVGGRRTSKGIGNSAVAAAKAAAEQIVAAEENEMASKISKSRIRELIDELAHEEDEG